MKKLLCVILLFIYATTTYSAAPSSTVLYNIGETELCTTIVVADTIVDTDSTTILTKYRPAPFGFGKGWEYILVSGALGGETSIDSFSVAVRLFYFDANGTQMYYTDIDTLGVLSGEAFSLGNILGDYITIKYKAYADDGNLCIMPTKLWLYRRKAK